MAIRSVYGWIVSQQAVKEKQSLAEMQGGGINKSIDTLFNSDQTAIVCETIRLLIH